MNSINIIGRLTHTPTLSTTPSGVNYMRFSVAVDSARTDADGNRLTDFFNCVAWRNTAEFIARNFGKGQVIGVTGSMNSRSYQGKDGNNKLVWEITANEISLCGDRKKETTETPENKVEKFEPVADADLPF